ncbi:MAG: M15 family metallopeptidase [Gemmatimonadetes bacterium]|nr:M15 family metallopeptidase [Gemmatimonadota bacterium]
MAPVSLLPVTTDRGAAESANDRSSIDRATSDRIAARHARSAARAARADRDDTRVDNDDSRAERRPLRKADFSALLALIAGAGSQVRADLVRDLPPETASLVDRLLNDAQDDATERTAIEGVNAESNDASEALRNGLRTRDASADIDPTPVRPLLQGDAAAHASAHASDRKLAELSRLMQTPGNSVEQLLARGDREGANFRAQLEALLATAGTPTGARFASDSAFARAALSRTAALSLVGNANTGTDGILDASALTARARTTDVTSATKDVAALDPELQARLAKVMQRMQDEFGHDVQVVETVRSQDRQDWLFAQGRTRGGPVVTWTRDSAHTQGAAVDVMIDGGYTNRDAFALLQRVAREEGLRTLGDRDPGHLELQGPGTPGFAADTTSAARTAQTEIAQRTMATGNAGVASVARVAGVAGVASVAMPGRGVRTVRSEGLDTLNTGAQANARGAADASLAAMAMARRDAGQQAGRDGMAQDRGTSSDARRDATREGETPAFGALHGGTTGASHGTHVHGANDVAPAGTTQAERVADIQQMRDDAPASPIARMTLDVDGANGVERITVGLRGNSVQAHIATDADTASRLRLHTAELQDALGRHGLDGDTVRISAAARAESTDSVRGDGDRDLAARLISTAASSQDGPGSDAQSGQQGRAPAREWDRQDARRDQQARTRDDQQDQQDARQRQSARDDARSDARDGAPARSRRTTLFTGQ